MVLGIVIGGIIPLFFIPLLEKYVVKSSLYISVDGNKTFKKDLTILREAIGKKRSRDGSYTKKQLEIYKKRALKKLLSK